MTPEEAIRAALAGRTDGATACPSEAARLLEPEGWRLRMAEVREAAAEMAGRGEIEVTQGGRVVDVRTARGPVRLRPA